MSAGKLILVTLPIGNIEDLTPRARKQLQESTFLLAEDERHIRKFLGLLGIECAGKRMDSFHDHSKQKVDRFIKLLKEGKDLTLVSEAGSPIISDPAFPLVREVVAQGLTVTSCPGVSSVMVALELSGLPPHPFHFHGFGPREEDRQRSFLESTVKIAGTHLIFEAPQRVEMTLGLIAEILPEAQVSILRELTKKFESTYYCQGKDLIKLLPHIDMRGEFVIAYYVDKNNQDAIPTKLVELAQKCLDSKAHPKDVAKLLGELLGKKTGDVYSSLAQK